MTNKQRKKVNSRTEAHNFGVILEHVDSKLDLIVEGHEMLDKKIDRVESKVDALESTMNQKFEVVNEKFEVVNQKFEVVNEKFDAVFDELHIIRNELKEKVGRDEFILLEKRVMTLEKKVGHHKN